MGYRILQSSIYKVKLSEPLVGKNLRTQGQFAVWVPLVCHS